MAEDLLVRQLNKARVLASAGSHSEAYLLLQSLLPQLVSRGDSFLAQGCLLLSESATALHEYQLSLEWIDLGIFTSQRIKAGLEEKLPSHSVL